MLRLAFVNFFRLCRRNASFTILSLVCLTCAFISFLYTQEYGYCRYVEIVEREKETQTLFFKCSDETTVKDIYAELDDDGGVFPKLSSVTASNELYAGIDWSVSESWYTPYGRFFTREEMENGAAVAILGIGYLKLLPQERLDTVWETGIEINGVHFEAIGNHYFGLNVDGTVPTETEATAVPSPVLMPLAAFWESGLTANKMRCVFAEPLTEAQITVMAELLQSYEDVYFVSLPKEGNYYAIRIYLGQVIPYTFIILLSLISIGAVVLHWLRREFVRYGIYLICGARRGQIAFLLSVAISLLVTIAFLFASFLIAQVTGFASGVLLPLPWQFHAALYAGMLLIALLVVNLKASPLIFRGRMLEK